MNIIQFWIVDTIVKVTPTNLATQQNGTETNQRQVTSDQDQDTDEQSPLLPK